MTPELWNWYGATACIIILFLMLTAAGLIRIFKDDSFLYIPLTIFGGLGIATFGPAWYIWTGELWFGVVK